LSRFVAHVDWQTVERPEHTVTDRPGVKPRIHTGDYIQSVNQSISHEAISSIATSRLNCYK